VVANPPEIRSWRDRFLPEFRLRQHFGGNIFGTDQCRSQPNHGTEREQNQSQRCLLRFPRVFHAHNVQSSGFKDQKMASLQ
jgi:hypothetical protein